MIQPWVQKYKISIYYTSTTCPASKGIFELHKFELSEKEKEGFHVNTLEQGGIELILPGIYYDLM